MDFFHQVPVGASRAGPSLVQHSSESKTKQTVLHTDIYQIFCIQLKMHFTGKDSYL